MASSHNSRDGRRELRLALWRTHLRVLRYLLNNLIFFNSCLTNVFIGEGLGFLSLTTIIIPHEKSAGYIRLTCLCFYLAIDNGLMVSRWAQIFRLMSDRLNHDVTPSLVLQTYHQVFSIQCNLHESNWYKIYMKGHNLALNYLTQPA